MRPESLCELFLRSVAEHGERVAVRDAERALTYRELERASRRLALTLIAAGVGPGHRVGLLLDRTVDVAVASLGAMRAAATYVPLDPAHPRARVEHVLGDAEIGQVVSDGTADHLLPEGVGVVRLAGALPAARGELPEVAADAPAYVIYTSGSSGVPKGVLVSHANVVALLRNALPLFAFGPADVWTLCHSHAFDFSVWELWGALATGGSCVVVAPDVVRLPDELLALLADRAVTVLNQIPSAFRSLVGAYEQEAPALALRYVIFGGEGVDLSLVRRFRERADAAGSTPAFVNMYGITETTVHVTWKPLGELTDDAARSPIGRALPHLEVAVLDDGLSPVADGQVGEMWVAGAGVAQGYLNRPELTRERFRELAVGGGARRWYRTGDLARVLPGGELDYVGRNDDQVKLRGYRIELGEIEAVVGACREVSAAAVTVARTEGGDGFLVALLVPGPGQEEASVVRAVRAAAAAALAPYMVPQRLMLVPELPHTSSGKLDRAALPRLARAIAGRQR